MNISTLKQILEALNRVINADLMVILKYEDDESLVALEAFGSLAVPQLKNQRVTLPNRPELSQALQLTEPSVLRYKKNEIHHDTYSEVVELPTDHSCMVAPLRLENKLIGALTIDVVTCDAFSLDQIRAIGGFAYLAARVMYEENRANQLSFDLAKMAAENASLRANLKGAALIGQSREWLDVVNQIALVAPTPATVMISGETGTGKEQVARAIHQWSTRSPKPFIALNCSAIVPELALSELFGHEKGAFTGADHRREGRFELARGGTLFLDEIADLPVKAQAQLLRVIQEQTFERVGGNHTLDADVRLVVASHQDLKQQVLAGQFREDLFYRLNIFPIHLPRLCERRGDIALLAEHLLGKLRESWAMPQLQLSGQAIARLETYSWPGNVRELRNILERATIIARGKTIYPRHLEIPTHENEVASGPAIPSKYAVPDSLNRLEKAIAQEILQALSESKGKIAGKDGAAGRLGIPPTTLHSTIKRLKLKDQIR